MKEEENAFLKITLVNATAEQVGPTSGVHPCSLHRLSWAEQNLYFEF